MRSHDENRRPKKDSDGRSYDQESIKKSYHVPRLIFYGNIREMTQAAVSGGMNDGAHGNFKT